MIEEVPCPSQKVIGVDRPTAERNGDAKLVFLITLTVKRVVELRLQDATVVRMLVTA